MLSKPNKLIVLLLVILLPGKLYAQCFGFSSYPLDTAGWNVNQPVSHYYNDTLVLTTAIGGQSGYAYFDSLIDLSGLNNIFDLSFDFKVDSGSSPLDTSDGFAFYFLSGGISDLGVNAGHTCGVPYSSIGLALVFDNHDNDGNQNNPLISLRALNNSGYLETNLAGTLCPDLQNQHFVINRSWHTCRITYSNGAITVSFDGGPVQMVANYTITSPGYFGFCASTGGGASNQAIKNTCFKVGLAAAFHGLDTLLCQGSGPVTLQLADNGLTWYDDMNDTVGSITPPVINTMQTGTVTYYVTQTVGSTESEKYPVNVTISSSPKVHLGNDTVLCGLLPYLGSPQENVTFIWNTGATDCCIQPGKAGIYTVTVSNDCGSDSDSITLKLNCKECLSVPTAFSPNGDGVNDFFFPRVLCPIRQYKMSVYDRWGHVVFTTEDVNGKWDGRSHGVVVDMESYAVVVSYLADIPNAMNEVLQGNVTVVK